MSTERSTRSFFDYLALARRRRWWVLAPIVLTTSLAYSWASGRTELYTSSSVVQVYGVGSSNARVINNEQRVIESSDVREQARRVVPQLSSYSSTVNDLHDFITISASSSSPELARATAQAVADGYVLYKRNAVVAANTVERRFLQTQIDELRADITELDDRISAEPDESIRTSFEQERSALYNTVVQLVALRITKGVQPDVLDPGVRVVDGATLPLAPSGAGMSFYIAIGLFLGAVAGLGLASVRDALDDRLKTVDDLENRGWSPVLAVVPEERVWSGNKWSQPISMVQPSVQAAEAFRNLRTSFRLMAEDSNFRVVLVTSGSSGEGKTTVAANLAMSLAATGVKVLLVDSDLRSPTIATVFSLGSHPGVSDLLQGKASIEDCSVGVAGFPNLSIITSGTPVGGPAELIGGRWDREFTRSLADAADLVVIDAAPILLASESQQLSSFVDGVVLTVRSKRTAARSLAQATQLVRRSNGKVVGFILNRARVQKTAAYGYDSALGQAPEPEEKKRSPAKVGSQ
jgi:capsular exopolysaccharide synthesis family protein